MAVTKKFFFIQIQSYMEALRARSSESKEKYQWNEVAKHSAENSGRVYLDKKQLRHMLKQLKMELSKEQINEIWNTLQIKKRVALDDLRTSILESNQYNQPLVKRGTIELDGNETCDLPTGGSLGNDKYKKRLEIRGTAGFDDNETSLKRRFLSLANRESKNPDNEIDLVKLFYEIADTENVELWQFRKYLTQNLIFPSEAELEIRKLFREIDILNRGFLFFDDFSMWIVKNTRISKDPKPSIIVESKVVEEKPDRKNGLESILNRREKVEQQSAVQMILLRLLQKVLAPERRFAEAMSHEHCFEKFFRRQSRLDTEKIREELVLREMKLSQENMQLLFCLFDSNGKSISTARWITVALGRDERGCLMYSTPSKQMYISSTKVHGAEPDLERDQVLSEDQFQALCLSLIHFGKEMDQKVDHVDFESSRRPQWKCMLDTEVVAPLPDIQIFLNSLNYREYEYEQSRSLAAVTIDEMDYLTDSQGRLFTLAKNKSLEPVGYLKMGNVVEDIESNHAKFLYIDEYDFPESSDEEEMIQLDNRYNITALKPNVSWSLVKYHLRYTVMINGEQNKTLATREWSHVNDTWKVCKQRGSGVAVSFPLLSKPIKTHFASLKSDSKSLTAENRVLKYRNHVRVDLVKQGSKGFKMGKKETVVDSAIIIPRHSTSEYIETVCLSDSSFHFIIKTVQNS